MTTPRGAVPREPSKVEQAQRLTSKAFDELVAQLESGSSESLQKYLRACARFHRYSFGNMMLILAQQPDATRVAGFQTWRSLGRNVRKGEKGLVIIAPVKLRRGNEDEDEEDAKPA
ncbi:MAG: ArdC family protein, partial [Planctomycetota bacterium]